MIVGFGNGQGLSDPVDDGVSDTEPGESKDDIFLATTHDIKEMFLGDPFDICIESASVVNCASFVCSLVDILNGNGGGEFLGGESVFSDELPVDAGDVCARVYQCKGVNNFEGVRGGDQLNRDMHRFI